MISNEIQCILSGEIEVKHGSIIQTIISYLARSQNTSAMAKGTKQFRQEETRRLKEYIDQHLFWITDINLENYISEGAEQKVYLKDGSTVLKLNDTIYYNSWIDYLNNLLLNNYFFPDTAYNLLGFFEDNSIVYAVVEQPFVKATEETNLKSVKEFMLANGFQNIRNNDYFNPISGVILEDLHDENVLTQNGILYFIDTVFYIDN